MLRRACTVVFIWSLVSPALSANDEVEQAKPHRPVGEFLAGTFILTQKSLDEAPYRYVEVCNLYSTYNQSGSLYRILSGFLCQKSKVKLTKAN